MKAFDNGCFYTVTASVDGCDNFADRWPCSGLRGKRVAFQYDKRNGDLVDMTPNLEEAGADGAAVLALSQDCQTYGQKRLKLGANTWAAQ